MADGLQVTIQTNLTPDIIVNPVSGQAAPGSSAAASRLLALLQPQITVTLNGAPLVPPIAPAGPPAKPYLKFLLGGAGVLVVGLAIVGFVKLVR